MRAGKDNSLIFTVPTDRARKQAMKNLIDTFFQGSVESAAAALLGMEGGRIDQDTLQRLSEMVSQARKEGRS